MAEILSDKDICTPPSRPSFTLILAVLFLWFLNNKDFQHFFFLWKIALLDSTSLRKFKIFQPEEH